MTTAKPWQRQAVQDIAACITVSCADPAAVNAIAGPLLEWMQEAPDRSDIGVRLHALQQRQQDGPDAFLRAAQVLYVFAVTGQVPS
jgi:hypothetical protein